MPIYNFAPGPSMLAPEVKENLAAMVLDWADGLSLAEYPHRSLRFEALLEESRCLVRHLLHIGNEYEVLFLMGGARQQFDWIARNFLQCKACYWTTGHWSEMAANLAQPFGEVVRVKSLSDSQEFKGFDYQFACINETVDGVEINCLPQADSPWVIDASSNIFSRPIDMSNVGLLMAGAQKNAGIAGVTIVVIHQAFLKRAKVATKDHLYSYQAHVRAGSMLVTPPTLAIGAMKCVLDWIKDQGGVEALSEINNTKAQLLYQTIDESNGFYRARVAKPYRSRMNVVFDLPSDELLEAFLQGAKEQGLLNLRGHRSAGGVRASIYNAMPLAGVRALVDWMKFFQNQQVQQ